MPLILGYLTFNFFTSQVIAKHGLNISKDVTDGTIHNKPGAAITLVEQLYIVLTNRV